MADWTTISSLATAFGTLVLAVATFSSVRSSNRSARIAQESLQVGLRPLLMPSRFEDATEAMRWGDGRWTKVEGGKGLAEVENEIFTLTPKHEGKEWICSVVRHWNLDRDDPR